MRCEHCPAPGACVAQKTGHAAFCGWAGAGGEWLARVVEMSAESTSPFTPPPSLVPVDESVRLVRAVAACPFRSRGEGCGCGGARCALRAARTVSYNECFNCIRRYG